MARVAVTPTAILAPGEPERLPVAERLAAARRRAYGRATDPRGHLRGRNGAIPMRGAYAMPASEVVGRERT